jgi:hypothetical protein
MSLIKGVNCIQLADDKSHWRAAATKMNVRLLKTLAIS